VTLAVHLNLDDAWPADVLGLPTRDVREWGPRLRYFAPARLVDAFAREIADDSAPFTLYGSGDFHYLAGVLLRRVDRPVHLISFDNHPDWDVRPPRWACGGWINRALAMPHVTSASVWGCGNFELNWPSRVFANHAALRSGRLRVFPWAERYGPRVRSRFDAIAREGWKDRFGSFARKLGGTDVYVTIDLDCLAADHAVTNWEQGLFTPMDVAWALSRLRQTAHIVGGDVCGAYSPQRYERWFQRLAAGWDHPKRVEPDADAARRTNVAALKTMWPTLVTECE
jgi:arginase family enzyme